MTSAIEIARDQPVSPPGDVWRWSHPADIHHAKEFLACAIKALAPGRRGPLILDLSEATHMDACGLQILLAIAVEALTHGRFFEISEASNAIRRDLQLTGLSYLLRHQD